MEGVMHKGYMQALLISISEADSASLIVYCASRVDLCHVGAGNADSCQQPYC